MRSATERGLLRAVRDCARMEMRCIGKDGSVVTLSLNSAKRQGRALFKDIAYALEDYVKSITPAHGSL